MIAALEEAFTKAQTALATEIHAHPVLESGILII
jgi:hypothetical protein